MNENNPHDDIRSAALEDAAEIVSRLGEALVTALLMALPWLLRAFCAGIGVAGAILVFNSAWSAFGGDPAAFIPAFIFAVVPLGYMIRFGAPGMMVAGLFSLGASQVLPAIPVYLRDIGVIAIIAAIVMTATKRSANREKK